MEIITTQRAMWLGNRVKKSSTQLVLGFIGFIVFFGQAVLDAVR